MGLAKPDLHYIRSKPLHSCRRA